MVEPERSVEDVKRALLRDIDAGKVQEMLGGYVLLMLDEGEPADVYNAAWRLYGECLVETGEWLGGDDAWGPTYRVWRLTDAGRAYLEAGTDG